MRIVMGPADLMTAFTENIAAGCIIWFREITFCGSRLKFWIDKDMFFETCHVGWLLEDVSKVRKPPGNRTKPIVGRFYILIPRQKMCMLF